MTKIAKNLLITAATTGAVAGTSAVTIYYVVNDNEVKEDVENRVNINTIITDDQISFSGKKFQAPTKDDITKKLIEEYRDNGLTLEDFEITSEIDPNSKPGFEIEIVAIGENFRGTKNLIVNFIHTNVIYLSDIVTPGYKFLDKKYDEMPDGELVLKDLKKQFPLLDINKVKSNPIILDDNDEYGFTISPKEGNGPGMYKGEVNVFVTLKKQISLVPKKVFISNGLNQSSRPDLMVVKNKIIKETKLVHLKQSDFDVKEVSKNSRTWINGDDYFVEVTGKGNDFIGTAQVKVEWNWLQFQQLSDVVKVKSIKDKFDSIPTSDEVIQKIFEHNPNLNKEFIKPITVDSAKGWAKIEADEKDENPYRGSAIVTFGVKRDIEKIFEKQKEIEFGNVNEKPNDEKIKEKILGVDSGLTAENYTLEFLESRTWSENKFKVKVIAHPTSDNFVGEVTLTIKYNLDSKRDLSEDLKATNLKINFANKPTEWEITDELVKQNPKLIRNGISINSINENSAIVSAKKGESLPYKGANIKINFNIQQSLDQIFKESERFVGFFGEGNLDDADTKTALDAVDNFVKSKVGEEEFKYIKCEIESTGTVRYFVEDKISSIYKGSVKITWKFNHKMQNVINGIPAFKGGTIGYRPTAANAWEYVSAELDKTELKGKWKIAWEDNGENKSLIKISPQSEDYGLLGSALIDWNVQTELDTLFVNGKNFGGYFGNGSNDELSKQMAYDGVDKYVSDIVGADQFKHLKREIPSDGQIKYTAQNTTETKFKNSVIIDWKFNVKTQNYINSLSSFNDGNIGWFESPSKAWNYTLNNLDKSELMGNYNLNWKDNNLLVMLKRKDIGFIDDALVTWSQQVNVQQVIDEMKINTLGWLPDNDTAKKEATKKLDETILKGKYNITTNSYNHFVITPKTNEFFGSGLITWSRAKTIQSVINASELNNLGWVPNENLAKEMAIKKLDATDLKDKYNIELDSRNDLIITSKVSEYVGTAKITWKRSTDVAEIINKAGINNIGWMNDSVWALQIAKEKLDETILKDKYNIEASGENEYKVTLKDGFDEFHGEGKITWGKKIPVQEAIDKAKINNIGTAKDEESALKKAAAMLDKTDLKGKYRISVDYVKRNVVVVESMNEKYIDWGFMYWDLPPTIEDVVKSTGINVNAWFKNYNDAHIKLMDALDKKIEGQYEIDFGRGLPEIPDGEGDPTAVYKWKVNAKDSSQEVVGSYEFSWNIKYDIWHIWHNDRSLEDLGPAKSYFYAEQRLIAKIDWMTMMNGKYTTSKQLGPSGTLTYVRVSIKKEFEYQFVVDHVLSQYQQKK